MNNKTCLGIMYLIFFAKHAIGLTVFNVLVTRIFMAFFSKKKIKKAFDSKLKGIPCFN